MAHGDAVVYEQRTGSELPTQAVDLCTLLASYMDSSEVRRVVEAYQFAALAHKDQRRLTGEPYIMHPLAVAKILAEMRLEVESIVAALLHDVIEDTPTAKVEIATRFGDQVAELVDGVSKLTQIDFGSKAEAQAENFRKMFLAMAQDIRVILIKLADRLHNMRTIWVMSAHKRWRIARETLEIYAPIAQRLGINTLRVELEDLGFAALYPMRYRVLKEKLWRQRGSRSEIVGKIGHTLEGRLAEAGIPGRVVGREKHLWGIYQKMRAKHGNFHNIFDVYGFRVTVDSVSTCYQVLGMLHGLYKPLPGRIKDYIAIPKANGYQSLHTTLLGPRRIHLEVQIRTVEMDKVAEAGIAAHWLYKGNTGASNAAHARAREWLRGLLEMQRNAGNSLEFIENVKIDLLPDEVYVFTPSGEIMELPRGATVVDFAYTVHSHIGDSCIAAMIDHRLTPLRTLLETGQTVEIITAPAARPNPAWLDFVVTAKARTAIRHSLKRLKGEEAINLGRRLVGQALDALTMKLEELPEAWIKEAVEAFGTESLDGLLEQVGLGQRMPWLVAQRLSRVSVEAIEALGAEKRGRATAPLAVRATEGAVITFARCCRPIPGDSIVGFASSGRGVVVHQQSCHNIREYRNHPEKWLDVQWDKEVAGEFQVAVAVDVVNRCGVLADVAATVSDLDSNIKAVDIDEKDGVIATIRLVLMVRNRLHLARLMRRLRVLNTVLRITRRRG
ncbi:RelA/SpoT family protein [Nitrococcus mobilis]|uniref:guanosine-3',5'-bis(diphosphate) 3'-diphosphatase n=1 Tax=Nitrococcus mobilis Nb-231 TaxID=314278 RepID=A4BQT2_9GAMM|nr:RelA/SpoT family protein [Nitrococcus mobilis]EAR21932.1 guanosine-3',5'-bis(diphosphate) 3'-pyrophosphohydrolase [Nitrococcus mobilis Nb-231]